MLLIYPVAFASRSIPRALFHTSRARSALKRFKLADIGEGITEVELIKWFVHQSTLALGDSTSKFQERQAICPRSHL